ncbi:chitinase [Pedobacter sp. HMF7647]|uniref:chitinase n=1 Tax=Hufsiella arboris TaxID=2695275 RepID=A0A7K1Y6U6_9SPHI|nr:glycoside hydrolase family 18 protein [Hufsiella arboris]MXV50160.1 chitinase [Hufsiella arboris]
MKVKALFFFALFILPALFFSMKVNRSNDAQKVIIGYVGGFRGLAKVEMIDPTKLTHINYAFVNIRNNRAVLEKIATDTINFKNLNALKSKNPALKILISIGGWEWSENFSDAVLTDTARMAFAKSAVDIIRKYNLDGVDIDWEYPAIAGEDGNVFRPEDGHNFTLMFRDLRLQLDTLQQQTGQKKLLTTAVPGFQKFVDLTEMGQAAKYLDYVNLMTYDFSASGLASHHTNLYASTAYPQNDNADNAVKAFNKAGVPMNKLVMGIAFYGRHYQLSDKAVNGLGDTMTTRLHGSGYTTIRDSLKNKEGYKYLRDKNAKAPYLYNSETKNFITFDDEWSVKQKCLYVTKNKMAGVMFWEYSSDPKGYLLTEINENLR